MLTGKIIHVGTAGGFNVWCAHIGELIWVGSLSKLSWLGGCLFCFGMNGGVDWEYMP